MDRLEIIETLKHLPVALENETKGLSEDTLRYRPSEASWSIMEIVGHLRDSAEVWHKRVNVAASLFDPRFVSFDGEASVKEKGYQGANLASLIAGIREWRLKTVDILVHTVDWTRIAQHPDLGRRSLKQWAEYMIAHEAEHLESIRALKEAATTARLP